MRKFLAVLISMVMILGLMPTALAAGANGTSLAASVSANGTVTIPAVWTIQKSVNKGSLDLFDGESEEVTWTISATKAPGTGSSSAVSGTVTVQNTGVVSTQGLAISVELFSPANSGTAFKTIQVSTGSKPVLAAGETYTYSYSTPVSLPVGSLVKATANVTITNHSGNTDGTPQGPSPSTSSTMTSVIDSSPITVTDSGKSWQFTSSGSQSFNQALSCADGPTYTNTASIAQTGATASASVTINCYGLNVAAGASTSYTRTYGWSIAKSVDHSALSLNTGDTGTVTYTVTATKDAGTDSNHAVNGTVTVSNPHPSKAANFSVHSSVGTVTCPSNTVAAGNSVNCTLAASVSEDGTAAVDVSLNGKDYAGSAAYSFANASVTKVNDEATVSDSMEGALGSTSASKTWTYAKEFSCSSAGTNTYDNVASIDGGPSASASVTVDCYQLDVSVTAATSYTRTYGWSIAKSADKSALNLKPGETGTVSYTVAVTKDQGTDSNHAVSGTVTVANLHPTKEVSFTANAGMGALTCPASTIPAGGSITCSVSAATAQDGTLMVTASSNGKSYTGSAAYSFANASVTEVDKTATVTDSMAGTLGTADGSTSWTYTKNFTYSAAGTYTEQNTATVTTSDTGAQGSANWTVNVTVEEPFCGCTYTIGYWKNHPANMNGLLTNMTLGSTNVSSSSQAVTILSSMGSNGIDKLKAQLLAAKLSIANSDKNGNFGSGAAVASTIAAADAFLVGKTSASWSTLSKSVQAQVNSWATTIDQFNNGLIGPGHCQ